jgi:hypothetical protein
MNKKENTKISVPEWDDKQAEKISDHALGVMNTRALNKLFTSRTGFYENLDNVHDGRIKQHVWISEEKIDGRKQTIINIWHKPVTRRPDEKAMQNPDYWFEYERCNTTSKLCDWIYQLVGKNWCTVHLIDELLDKVSGLYLYKTGEVMFLGIDENDGFEKEHCKGPR